MKRTLHLEIVAGDARCTSTPGVFCPQLLTSHMGMRWHCALFRQNEELAEDEGGWNLRHPECIAAEVK